ncbi:MAG: Acyl-CoA dehydrogenase, short-chain specific [Bacteriovoracaceae bacterium]|nr:Acyl-CoA dehydrogenase, short-chain specific [Bacteriovoracaceae bacterium]
MKNPSSDHTSSPESTDSFCRALFNGHLLEDRIFPYPDADTGPWDDVRDVIVRFKADKVDSKKIDSEAKVPAELLEEMKQMGLFGVIIPEEFGGFGMSATGYSKIMEAMVQCDSSLTLMIGAHQSIGMKGLLLFGTPEQKKKYLPKLATGEMVASFALTEPTSGSDAQSIKTKAVLSADKKYYTINGSKLWITNGGFADFFTVFAKVDVEQDGEKKEKVTAFIVERSMGIKSLSEEHKLGIKGSSTVQLVLEDVKVPVENLLGELGKGFKVAMNILNSGRLGLAAGCIGASKMVMNESVKYAAERKQFSQPITNFKMIKAYIAQMEVTTYVLESMVYLTTSWIDKNVHDYSMESAICKVFGSEAAWENVNRALQIAGGNGYMKDYPYEQALRDSRINLIFEGTNEILRLFIGLTGLQSVAQALQGTQGAVKNLFEEPIKGFGAFYGYASKRLRQKFSPDMAKKIHPLLANQTKSLGKSIAELSEASEAVVKKYRKNVVDEQHDLRRIADVTIDLYAISATLARVTSEIEKKGEEGTIHTRQIAAVFTSQARRRIRENIRSLELNKDKAVDAIADRVVKRVAG